MQVAGVGGIMKLFRHEHVNPSVLNADGTTSAIEIIIELSPFKCHSAIKMEKVTSKSFISSINLEEAKFFSTGVERTNEELLALI